MAVEEGMQLGREEGRQEGAIAVLQSLIQFKFGEIPDWAQQHLQQATQKQIEEWTAAILTAENLEGMLRHN